MLTLIPGLSLTPLGLVLAAAATAFFATLLLGRPVITRLLALKFRDGDCVKDSATLARLHAEAGKSATPTMGGVIILASFSIALALWAPPHPAIFAGWLLVLAFGVIGLLDDRIKLLGAHADGTKRDGLSGRARLLTEIILAGSAAIVLGMTTPLGADAQATISIPFIGESLALGGFWVPLAMLVIVGTANAANLTDGLDGLASGVVGVAAIAIAAIGLLVMLGAVSHGVATAATAELAVFAGALAGSCFGFLCFNRWPAKVFMGDTGSLAIGAGLGYAALLLKLELALAIIGGVLVIEAVSVIMQVGSFKLTGKRILRCAPIHHHFQFSGWKEQAIVRRFWLAGAACAVAGLAVTL